MLADFISAAQRVRATPGRRFGAPRADAPIGLAAPPDPACFAGDAAGYHAAAMAAAGLAREIRMHEMQPLPYG